MNTFRILALTATGAAHVSARLLLKMDGGEKLEQYGWHTRAWHYGSEQPNTRKTKTIPPKSSFSLFLSWNYTDNVLAEHERVIERFLDGHPTPSGDSDSPKEWKDWNDKLDEQLREFESIRFKSLWYRYFLFMFAPVALLFVCLGLSAYLFPGLRGDDPQADVLFALAGACAGVFLFGIPAFVRENNLQKQFCDKNRQLHNVLIIS